MITAGISMFFWCWISIEMGVMRFLLLSLLLYYLPHFVLWMFSTIVLIFAICILWGRLAASSETRKFVIKQNAIYVLVLGIETSLIIPLWATQIVLLDTCDDKVVFLTNASFGLAVVFAILHSLRGTVDLLVWWLTFSIGPKDIKELYHRIKLTRKKDPFLDPQTLNTPLINGQVDSTVNRALRRDAMYCINIGILDAVKLNAEEESKRNRLGSVRVSFVAQAMVMWDEENQQKVTAKLHENPFYREQNERKIEFPPSGSIQQFSFIDLEPSVFSLLRNSYGIGTRTYRESFKIKNAADVESSGMLEKFTEGKSGSFFYFTRDFRYLIKTVTPAEEKFLQKIAYKYYTHMKANPDSLIVRFFGLHKVRLAREQGYITVVVMDNIFANQDRLAVPERYDLKGSTVGRRVLKKGSKVRGVYRGTLKDLDLKDRNRRIVIGSSGKQQLMEQLKQDVAFLTSCKIMDYSMLLGIHRHSMGESSLRGMQSGSIEVVGGEDFVDVNPLDLTARRGSAAVSSPSAISTPSSTFDRHDRGLVPFGTRMSRPTTISVLSVSERGSVSSMAESSGYSPHTPWFRRDFGGLRSYSPFHPCTIAEREESENREDITAFQEYNGLDASAIPVDTYYFGLVDILQQYTLEKRVEHFIKTNVMCKDKNAISAINERDYGRRFLDAMDRIFE